MNLTVETVGTVFAFSLTVLVFTYLIGDNPFYRLAIHMFLGVAAAYATIVTLQSFVIPRFAELIDTYQVSNWTLLVILAVPWLFACLLLLRASSSFAPAGNIAIALMVGVGSGLAIGGALTGTLIPQVQASWGNAQSGSNLIDNLILWCPGVLTTSTVLLYFLYIGRKTPGGRGERHPLTRPIEFLGQAFLSVALAALYVGALVAYFAIFIERIDFLRQSFMGLLAFFGLVSG